MVTVLVTLLVLVVETALATFVAARARHYRPSHLFVYLSATIMAVVALATAATLEDAVLERVGRPYLGATGAPAAPARA
jgi:hypothetical protein